MYGNGCAGSTASGVRTGKIRSSNTSLQLARRCAFFRSVPLGDPDAARVAAAGGTRFSKTRTWRATSSCARASDRVELLRGLIPSGDVPVTPASSCSRRPGDPNLEELVEVVAEDRQESRALERGGDSVLGAARARAR